MSTAFDTLVTHIKYGLLPEEFPQHLLSSLSNDEKVAILLVSCEYNKDSILNSIIPYLSITITLLDQAILKCIEHNAYECFVYITKNFYESYKLKILTLPFSVRDKLLFYILDHFFKNQYLYSIEERVRFLEMIIAKAYQLNDMDTYYILHIKLDSNEIAKTELEQVLVNLDKEIVKTLFEHVGCLRNPILDLIYKRDDYDFLHSLINEKSCRLILNTSIYYKQIEVIEYILTSFKDVIQKDKVNVLEVCFSHGNIEILDLLIDHLQIKFKNEHFMMLYEQCARDSVDMLQILEREGFKPSHVHFPKLIMNKKNKIIKYLLPRFKEKLDSSCLITAVLNDNLSMFHYLIDEELVMNPYDQNVYYSLEHLFSRYDDEVFDTFLDGYEVEMKEWWLNYLMFSEPLFSFEVLERRREDVINKSSNELRKYLSENVVKNVMEFI